MKYLDCGPQVFNVPCPECQQVQHIPAEFSGRLTVDTNGGRLSLRTSTKSLEHNCGNDTQPGLPLGEDE